jgi:hypothetical protein
MSDDEYSSSSSLNSSSCKSDDEHKIRDYFLMSGIDDLNEYSKDRLEKDINTLIEIIYLGDCFDYELLHSKEDELLKAFITNIANKKYNIEEIYQIATLLSNIPEYTKWYA